MNWSSRGTRDGRTHDGGGRTLSGRGVTKKGVSWRIRGITYLEVDNRI